MLTKRHLNNDIKGLCLATESSNGLIFFIFIIKLSLFAICLSNIQKNKSTDFEKFNDCGVVILYINSFE